MSLAAATRRAVDDHPFLLAALRAGVVNYTAAARFLDVDGDDEAVATALRRYADDLEAYGTEARTAQVRMRGGVGPVDDPADALLAVGSTALGVGGDDGNDRTGIVATGEIDAAAFRTALCALAVDDVPVVAAGFEDGTMVAVVDRRDGANAVRAIEDAIERVPDR